VVSFGEDREERTKRKQQRKPAQGKSCWSWHVNQ